MTIQQALRQAADKYDGVPFTLVPGNRGAIPCYQAAVGYYEVPVVTVGWCRGRRIVCYPCGGFDALPRRCPVEYCAPQVWAGILWRYPSKRDAVLSAAESAL